MTSERFQRQIDTIRDYVDEAAESCDRPEDLALPVPAIAAGNSGTESHIAIAGGDRPTLSRSLAVSAQPASAPSAASVR